MAGLAAEIERACRRGAARGLNQMGTTVLRGARKDAPIGPPSNIDSDERKRAIAAREEVHPGHLKRSGSRTRATPVHLALEVTFKTEYAAAQEVHDDWRHPRGGKAHYLGDQVKAHAMVMVPIIAHFVQEELRKVRV